jgi:hypothetical protein
VILSPQARRDLSWIISLTPLQCFAPLWNLSPRACDLEVQTDASRIGYGIWFQGSLHQGHWDSTTTHLHINVLESTVLWIFLDCILSQLSSQRNILWRIDNTTALAYIKKEGGNLQSLSPGDRGEDSDQGSPDVRLHPSGLYSHRGKHPGRRSFSLPRDSRLAAASLSVPGDIGKIGSPIHRPLRQSRFQTDSRLLQLGRDRQTGDSQRTLPKVGLHPCLRFSPPIPLLKRVVKKLEMGSFILISPLLEAQTWLASLLSLTVLEVRRLSFIDNLVTDLVAWRIIGGSTPSRTSL